MATTEIVIIGLGGVGGYFGFKLAQKYVDGKDVEITFVARNPAYEIIRKNGLTLLSPEHTYNKVKPERLLQSVREIPVADVVVICVKEYDLEKVCRQLKDKILANTVILPLMNGVDIYDRIRAIISDGIVLPACVYVASHIKEKGIVEHKGKPGKIILGKDPQHPLFVPELVVNVFQKAGIHVDYKEDPFADIWEKFMFIASFGLVSARYDKSMGQINENPALHGEALSIMKEIENIAERKGIVLPRNIIELTFQKVASFPYNTPTSLQLDIQSNNPANELELFAGAVLNYGKSLGIPVLATQKVYNEIMEGFVKNANK